MSVIDALRDGEYALALRLYTPRDIDGDERRCIECIADDGEWLWDN